MAISKTTRRTTQKPASSPTRYDRNGGSPTRKRGRPAKKIPQPSEKTPKKAKKKGTRTAADGAESNQTSQAESMESHIPFDGTFFQTHFGNLVGAPKKKDGPIERPFVVTLFMSDGMTQFEIGYIEQLEAQWMLVAVSEGRAITPTLGRYVFVPYGSLVRVEVMSADRKSQPIGFRVPPALTVVPKRGRSKKKVTKKGPIRKVAKKDPVRKVAKKGSVRKVAKKGSVRKVAKKGPIRKVAKKGSVRKVEKDRGDRRARTD